MSVDQQSQDAMTDVRRAYRLVWAYQRRMLDMVQAVVKAFPETTHHYWTPTEFDGLPRRASDPIGCWAWDALPYYSVSWLRVVEGLEEKHMPLAGRWMLEIQHEADNGWKDGKDEPDARIFEKAENSSSTLSIIIWKSEVEKPGNWYAAWNAYSKDWPDAETDPNAVDEESGLRAVIVSQDMAEFASVEDVTAMANEARRRGREELGLDLSDLEAQLT